VLFRFETGVPDFENAARRAVESLWSRRSALDLVGSNIDVDSGVWKNPHSGKIAATLSARD
jgi:hypothetical protein